MNYGYGPAMPWSYGSPWSNPTNFGGNYGTGFGFPTTNFSTTGGMGYGYGPANWSYFGTFPTTGFGYGWAPMTDEELEYRVEQSLDNDPSIPAHVDIDVDVTDGIVTLSGTVPNKRIKHAAGDDAWWLPQVIDVHNTIEVQPRKQRTGMTTTQTTRRGTTSR
ncbi:MAG TPA: BON domain-containing protein [Chloroflexota bacterium]|nr:BON domain-containing protein [Chloroflexota bacterium]